MSNFLYLTSHQAFPTPEDLYDVSIILEDDVSKNPRTPKKPPNRKNVPYNVGKVSTPPTFPEHIVDRVNRNNNNIENIMHTPSKFTSKLGMSIRTDPVKKNCDKENRAHIAHTKRSYDYNSDQVQLSPYRLFEY